MSSKNRKTTAATSVKGDKTLYSANGKHKVKNHDDQKTMN